MAANLVEGETAPRGFGIAHRYLAGGYYGGYGGGMMMGGMMMGGMMGRNWGLLGDPDTMYNGIPFRSPEGIIEYRYSRGEISRREYRQMMRDIY